VGVPGTQAALAHPFAGSSGGSLSEPAPTLLTVSDLRVQFQSRGRIVRAVEGITFSVKQGSTLAVIGESGSGKSVTSRAILGLLPKNTVVTGGVEFNGQQLLGLPDRSMREIRGRDIGFVPQDPARSLNPTLRVGQQVVEALRIHNRELSRKDAQTRAIELLSRVRIPSASQRFHDYPHQLSGGMRQRVLIAMALACSPKLVIADEATTALDVTTQEQIMSLLLEIQGEARMALLLISHDLALARAYADDLVVMYAGRVVEAGSSEDVFTEVRMPYTEALLEAIPSGDATSGRLVAVPGQPPDPSLAPEVGCVFAARCGRAEERCLLEKPIEEEDPKGHRWSCFYALGQ
jgi:oligopeptide/dipeptide ABC transporter ATP-binding protein